MNCITKLQTVFLIFTILFSSFFSYLSSASAATMLSVKSVNKQLGINQKIDLTDVWVGTNSAGFTIDSRGCTSGSSGTVNGIKENSSMEFAMIQKGNKLIFPTFPIAWSNGDNNGSYLYSSRGVVTGNKIKVISSGKLLKGYTQETIGNISNNANTITGEIFCKAKRGSATGRVVFTWKRKVDYYKTFARLMSRYIP